MPSEVQRIKDGKKIIALVFSKKIKADGVKFLTPNNYPLQIGLMEYKEGKYVAPHYHPRRKSHVVNTQEFLYIEKGSADIVIFTKKWKIKKKLRLTKGDSILFVDCGHSVEMNKNCRVIEVKQGPYPGVKKAKIYRD